METTTTTKALDLEFELESGKSFTVTCPDYLDDLTREQVEAQAAEIIAAGAFAPEGSNLVRFKSFEYIDKTTRKTEIDA
ncbi:DUF2922 domain-containing protein [Eubacterium sp. 1001713B170207_170306_E7]|uniref:DUF2922 domain-containing protein n=1 Tax=Eubacterium sp. 1001713B170207_170306_E7 TaxID=2787097 RepID=UPI00189A7BF4|nr:DUF2922 domain-containing protein [Eubacterium sp. 1001713B170207_170306_E7]